VAEVDGAKNWRAKRTLDPRSVGEGSYERRTSLHAVLWICLRSSKPFHAQRLLEKVKAIADTGFLVAFGNRKDQHHKWAQALAERVTEPLLTCEPVLAEAAFHLNSTALVLAFVRSGLARPAFVVGDHLTRLTELAARYADRQPDLADLCLIRMSELYPKFPVITTDVKDFRVYRRGRREAIPFIHPQQRLS